MFENSTVLITGGTGSFGKQYVQHLLKSNPKKIILYSRDEYKHAVIREELKEHEKVMRYVVGDVRDKSRLMRAMWGVDYVIHAAALKRIEMCEYNPIEAINTNIIGASNVIDCAVECGVKKVVALSTDKACDPVTLYGATKLASDKLFVAGNAYSGGSTNFIVVRYGNVANSRGSIIPFYQELIEKGKDLPITNDLMTRFFITFDQAIESVDFAFTLSGGEIVIRKIPSIWITDLADMMIENSGKNLKRFLIGSRANEKLHEKMITIYDDVHEYGDYYIIYPNSEWFNTNRVGIKKSEFSYISCFNNFMNRNEIKEALKNYEHG